MHIDPRPSLNLSTVAESRLPLASELERDPLGVRLGKLAAMTLAVCLAIMAVVFSVQLIIGVGGGR